MDAPAATPGPDRLLAVIELQNAIAAAAMTADQVMRLIAERAVSMTSAPGALVALAEGDDLICRASAGTAPAVGQRLPKAWSLAGVCITERRPVRADNAATDPRVDPETKEQSGAGSMVCVPLLYGEHAVGVLEVMSHRTAAFTDEDVGTLPLLGQIVAIALHRAYTYPRPRLDNLHDPLTGLANRRAFDERIEAELGRNQRYGHSFSLILLRLVGLETASDRLGQVAADKLLVDIAGILQHHTRAIDTCFRLSANELAIVMPGTTLDGAGVLTGRFRARITPAHLGGGTVSARFGVVEAGNETADDLTARANAAVGDGT